MLPQTLWRPSSFLKRAIEPGGHVSKKEITRRDILRLALCSPVLALAPGIAQAQKGREQKLGLQTFKNAPSRVVLLDDMESVRQVKLVRQWKGSLCHSRLVNSGSRPARV